MTREDEIRARLEQRTDPLAAYLLLRLERAVCAADLEWIEAELAVPAHGTAPAREPLKALHQKLSSKLENILTVADDRKLQAALSGEESSPESWTLLLSHMQPAPLPKVSIPKVTGLVEKEKIRTRMLVELLSKLATHRSHGNRHLSAKELRETLQARTPAAVQKVLDWLPDV